MARSAQVRSFVDPGDSSAPALRAVGRASAGTPHRPGGTPGGTIQPALRLDGLVTRQMRARRGEVVVYRGSRASGLYMLRSGSCKSVLAAPNGLELVAGFHIAGDVLGLQTASDGRHDATVVALEDCDICVATWDSVHDAATRSVTFRDDLWRFVARETTRQREATAMLGVMRAEQRLAWFLLDLADRYGDRGYSPCEFILRMTREDIGSCLGLSQETVSRLFRRFHRDGLARIEGRAVRMIDRESLRKLVDDTANEPTLSRNSK